MATRLQPDLQPELRDIHAGLRTGPYIQGLWSRRGYIWFVAVSELRSRQMTSVLGNLWHLLNPVLQILVYYVIFGVVLEGIDRGVDNYILFIAVGVFLFADIQRAVTSGGNSLVNNRGLLQAISFPRALLPITSTVTESLATLPSLVIVYAVAMLSGESASMTWILFPVVVLTLFWFNLGFAMIAARGTTHLRDLQQILPFVFRILIYTSGVIFSVDSFAGDRAWAWLFQLNPIYCYLSIGRWTISGGPLEVTWFVSAGAWTFGALLLGFWWFRRAEETYGRD